MKPNKKNEHISKKENHEKEFTKEQSSKKRVTHSEAGTEDRGGFFGKRWFPFMGGKK